MGHGVRIVAVCAAVAIGSGALAFAAGEPPRFGAWQQVATSPPGGSVQELATGDVTGDGLVDVVVTRIDFNSAQTFPIEILVNDGRGGFRDQTAQLFEGLVPRPEWPRQTVLADFNGDRRADILTANTGNDVPPFPGSPSTLVLSSANGKFVDASGNLPREPAFTHSAAAGDVDQDGDADVLLGHLGRPVELLLNDGSGRFTSAPGLLPPSIKIPGHDRYTRSAFLDVNGDGSLDLVLAAEDHNASSAVLLNDGRGRFTELLDAFPSKPFGPDAIGLVIRPIELNGDSRADLLIAYTKGNPFYVGRWIQVLINNGGGTFRDETAARFPQVDNASRWPYEILLADLNRDGALDLGVVAPFGPTPESPPFYLNRGDGTFEPLGGESFANPPLGIFALLEANGDGRVDILTSTFPGVHYLIPQSAGPKPEQPAKKTVKLTVKIRGNGKVSVSGQPTCAKTCTRRVQKDATLTLRALPPRGWRLADWTGSCKGKLTKCRLTIPGDAAVAARFTKL